jgi:hypothetical protein
MAAKIITSGRYNCKSLDKKYIKLLVENNNPKVEGLTIFFFSNAEICAVRCPLSSLVVSEIPTLVFDAE